MHVEVVGDGWLISHRYLVLTINALKCLMKVLCLQTCLFMIGGHKVRARDRTPLQHIHSLEQTLGQTLFGLCPLLGCGQTYLNRIKRMGSKTFGNHCHMGWFVVLLKNVNYMRPFPASEFCLLIDSICHLTHTISGQYINMLYFNLKY